jgi:hypothetical protein
MATPNTVANAFLKENYEGEQTIAEWVLEKYPLLAMVRRTAKANYIGGRYHFSPVNTAPQGALGGSFAAAQAAAQQNLLGSPNAFEIPPVFYYGVQEIQGTTWRQAAAEEFSFISMLQKATQEHKINFNQDIAQQLYGTGNGVVDTVLAITTTTNTNDTLTVSSAKNFYVGQSLQVASSPTASPRAYGSSIPAGLQITGINRGTNTLLFAGTVTSATIGIPGLSVGDSIFKAGNSTGLSTPMQYLAGLEAWCPFGGVSQTDSFFNVNRSVDNFLYGTSYDGTGGASLIDVIDLAVTAAEAQLNYDGNTLVMSPGTYQKVQRQLRSFNRFTSDMLIKRPIISATALGKDTFVEGISYGSHLLVKDNACPVNRIYGFQEGDLELLLLSDGWEPTALGTDGYILTRDALDQVEIRYCQAHQLKCTPKNLLTIKVNASPN